MKRVLLATILLGIAPFAASAQGIIPVYDNAQIIQRAAQFAQTGHYWNEQIVGTRNIFNQAAGIWRASTGPRPMDGIAQILRMAGINLPGLQSGDIETALRGSSQYAEAAEVIRRNLFAEPMGEDADAVEMALRRTGIANRFTDAMASVRAAEQRLPGIRELRDRAGQTADLQESMALQNRIAAEQAALTNDSDRTQRMLALHQTQDRIEIMRDREAGRQTSQRWFDTTQQAWNVRW